MNKRIAGYWRAGSVGILLVALACGGCASVPQRGGFESVSLAAKQRLGQPLIWAQNQKQQQKLDGLVHRILQRQLTPSAAVEVALLNNPELQARYEQLGISQAEVVQAGLISNPVLAFDFRFPAAPNYGWDASIAQDFANILLLPARKNEAHANFKATQAMIAQSVIKLAYRTRQAFDRVVGDRQMIQLETDIKKGQDAALDLAKKMRQAGNTPPLAYDRQLVIAEQVRMQLSLDKASYLQDREHLYRLMGLWGWDASAKLPVRLPDPLHETHFAGLTALALRRSLTLKMARNGLKAAAVAVKVSGWAGILPGATIGANYVRDPDVRGTLGPAISIPVPIFNQGQPAQAIARARYLAAYRHYESLAIGIRSQVRTRWVALKAAFLRVLFYRKVMLPLRRRMLHETQLSYNGMLDSGFLLMQAKIDEINAARRYVKALEMYWLDRARLSATLGGRLPTASTHGMANKK